MTSPYRINDRYSPVLHVFIELYFASYRLAIARRVLFYAYISLLLSISVNFLKMLPMFLPKHFQLTKKRL